jgi:hypothetical protein
MLTLTGGLCCVDFMNSVGVAVGVWRQRLALPSEEGEKIQSLKRRIFFLNKGQDDG